jgi:hypothetical protein
MAAAFRSRHIKIAEYYTVLGSIRLNYHEITENHYHAHNNFFQLSTFVTYYFVGNTTFHP